MKLKNINWKILFLSICGAILIILGILVFLASLASLLLFFPKVFYVFAVLFFIGVLTYTLYENSI